LFSAILAIGGSAVDSVSLPVMPYRPPVHEPLGRRPGVRSHERGSASARGYDRLWQAFRRTVLADHPLCADCQAENRLTPATELHHLAKLRARPDLRLEPTNVRPLCQSCHAIRTARGE